MSPPGPEIHCPACNRDTLLLRRPVYEGFRKTGESLACAGCGHAFATEADVPFVGGPARPAVFTEADRPPVIRAFDGRETERLCRHCAHYTVNPFRQWCGRRRRDVEATDTCEAFTARPAPPPDDAPPAPPGTEKKQPLG